MHKSMFSNLFFSSSVVYSYWVNMLTDNYIGFHITNSVMSKVP